MINKKMAEDFVNLGIRDDDTVLVHSSLSSLGPVDGGADSVIDTLLYVLRNGTLLVPSLSFESVTKENPLFSVNDTPSCIGKISDTFRKREGVIRSIHPTHSVCGLGKYAEEILSQHIETDTPAGAKSPFALLPKYKGKVLMLGCGLRPNTSMHAIEELTRPDYLMNKERTMYTLIDKNGEKTEKVYETHNFTKTIQRYDRLADVMEITSGKVLEAQCYLIDAETMWERANEQYKRDAHYFVDFEA